MASEAIKKTKNRYNKKGNPTGYWEDENYLMFTSNGENLGEITGMGFYSDGKKKGTWKFYDDNGTLRIECPFKKDIACGISNIYNERGRLIEEILEIN